MREPIKKSSVASLGPPRQYWIIHYSSIFCNFGYGESINLKPKRVCQTDTTCCIGLARALSLANILRSTRVRAGAGGCRPTSRGRLWLRVWRSQPRCAPRTPPSTCRTTRSTRTARATGCSTTPPWGETATEPSRWAPKTKPQCCARANLGATPLRSRAGEHRRLTHSAYRARNVRQESKPWEGSVESTAIFSIAIWFLQDVVLEKNYIVVLLSNHVNI